MPLLKMHRISVIIALKIIILLFNVDLIQAKCIPHADISCDPDFVKFYLYKTSRDYEEIKMGSLSDSNFNRHKNIILIIHGFTQSYLSDSPIVIKDAYLRNGFGKSSNVIIVDWGELSGAYASTYGTSLAEVIAELPEYISVVANVPTVGNKVAEFLLMLCKHGMTSPNRIHMVGFSLGAHIAGHAASIIHKSKSQYVARVTGIDPAGPLFLRNPLIGKQSASFVDILHANRGVLGHASNLGHVDFLVNNGGPFQPGCYDLPLNDGFACSHDAAPHYFAQSIDNGDIQAVEYSACYFCTPKTTTFGHYCPVNAIGVYKVDLDNTFGTREFMISKMMDTRRRILRKLPPVNTLRRYFYPYYV